jgi:hypothetical protein
MVRHSAQGGLPIDAVRGGDPPDLPVGSDDPAILLWAEREGCILVTEDVHTMPGHLTDHLQAGHHSPGLFVIRVGYSIGKLVSHPELVAHAGEAADYQDAITYVP